MINFLTIGGRFQPNSGHPYRYRNIPLILNPYVTWSTRLVSIRVELAICNNISYTSYVGYLAKS